MAAREKNDRKAKKKMKQLETRENFEMAKELRPQK